MFDKSLTSEISQIAKDNQLEAEALMAVVEVESGGKLGTMIKGRMEPLIRFEGHYFYRLLPAVKRNIAITQRLAHPRAGQIKNPGGQKGRWKLLDRAKQIDPTAAFSSVSWGAGQVMGAHWRWLGYASIDALVIEARDNWSGQIRLMMRYIEKADLIGSLQTHDWAGFARAYNGPAYRKYRYDVKLEKAYQKHCRESGTASSFADRKQRNALALLRMGSQGIGVSLLQSDLCRAGFTINVDGDFGPTTRKAVKAFQMESSLDVDGIVGPKTLEFLRRHLHPAT